MKRILTTCLVFFISFSLVAQNDGPYVFQNKGNKIKIVRVTENGISEEVQRSKKPFRVYSDDGKYSFEVNIHKVERPQWKWEMPKKVLLLSDPHGNLEAFLSVLWAQGVIDREFNWTFGNAHFMLIGDILDRGENVQPILWLMYKLEAEAERAGGAVHFLLGNHEEMILRNNVRYAHEKYTGLVEKMGIEYRELFAPGSILGDWIMSRNTIEQIGDDLIVHAGLSREFLDWEWSVPELNERVSSMLYMNKADRDASEEGKFLFGSSGPLWYRGMIQRAERYNPIAPQDVDAIREYYGIDKIYVGHTIFDEVETNYDGKVIGVNVDNARNMARGASRGVLIEGDKRYVIYDDPQRREDLEFFNSVEIKALLDGLNPGDTMVVSMNRIPYSHNSGIARDTMIVSGAGEFYYKKDIPHTVKINIDYRPADGIRIFDINRISLVVNRGDRINLNGEVKYLGSVTKSGGVYDDPVVVGLESISNEANRIKSDRYSKYISFKGGDKDSLAFYLDQYQQYRNEEERKQIVFVRDSVNSEYAVSLFLGNLHNKKWEDVKKRYDELSRDVKSTHLGRTLRGMEGVFKNIEVGNHLKDFQLIESQGDTVKLSDYRGKYLLIYHWGLCPGTIWLHPKLLELYELYGDKNIEVLAISEDNLRDMFVASGNDLRLLQAPQIKALAEHPWKSVYYSNPANAYITDELYLYVLPTIMLISPEGETLLRGYTEKYEDLKKFWEEL